MPISSQCLQNKSIGEFYNKTHYVNNKFLMKLNSNHDRGLDNNYDELYPKDNLIPVDLISVTNNNCFNFKKAMSFEKKSTAFVVSCIFLLNLKSVDASLTSNASTEASISTFPSINQTDINVFGAFNSSEEINYFHQNKQYYIDNDSSVTSNVIKKKVKTHRIKRTPTGDEDGIRKFKEMIDAQFPLPQALVETREQVMQLFLEEIARRAREFGLDNLPNPLRFYDLPVAYRVMLLQTVDEVMAPDAGEDGQPQLGPVIAAEEADDEMNAPDER